MDIVFRNADLSDVDIVAQIAIETFVDKFAHLYSLSDLQTYLRLAYNSDAIAQTLTDPGASTPLLYGDKELLGFALIGACGLPHPEVLPGDGELKRFYVKPGYTGRGLGSKLYDEAERQLLQNGPRTLWLGVFSDNPGAQAFYQRRGYVHVGEYEFPVGETRDREFIFRKDH